MLTTYEAYCAGWKDRGKEDQAELETHAVEFQYVHAIKSLIGLIANIDEKEAPSFKVFISILLNEETPE